MNPYYKLLLLITILPAFSFAQSNFKPGYTVTLKGDTIKGEIDYKEWYKNPKGVRFKSNAGHITTFNHTNATAFGVYGVEYYDRFIMPISMDDIESSRLTNGLDTTMITDTLFLRVIAKGKYLRLYSYTDNVKSRFIVWDSQTALPRELSYHLYRDTSNYDRVIKGDYYKNQLIKYAYVYERFNPELGNRIHQAGYNNDITGIIDMINGDNTQKTTGKNRNGSRFFIGADLNRSSLKYNGSIKLAENPQDNESYFPELTFGADLFLNSNVGKLIVRGEIDLYSTNFTASSIIESPVSPTIYSLQKFNQHNISFNPQIIYNIYNNNAVKIFIGSGIKLNVSGYSKRSYTLAYNGVAGLTEQDNPNMRTLWVQIPFKVGLTIHNKLEFYGRYILPTSLTDNYTGFSGDINMIGAGFNYLFGIK